MLSLFGCSQQQVDSGAVATWALPQGLLVVNADLCTGCQRCEINCTLTNDGVCSSYISRVKIQRRLNLDGDGNGLLSGNYDLNRTALLISQTGGGCRATNYIAFIRKALENAGMPNIPVISINPAGLEKNPGFKYEPALLHRAMQALVYGDTFMRVLYRTRPYEKVKGSANACLLYTSDAADE